MKGDTDMVNVIFQFQLLFSSSYSFYFHRAFTSVQIAGNPRNPNFTALQRTLFFSHHRPNMLQQMKKGKRRAQVSGKIYFSDLKE